MNQAPIKWRVLISPAMSSEYEAREVYPFITGPGEYKLDKEQALELLSDAEYQTDKDMEIEHEPDIKRAYRMLAKAIRQALALATLPQGNVERR